MSDTTSMLPPAPAADEPQLRFVSVTRLRMRSLRFMPAFILDTVRTRLQVTRADGYDGGALLADRRRTFWTMTVWRDQAAMRRYMTTGAHLKAMPKLLEWCDEASVVHWVQAGPALPDWAEAERRMRTEGRASQVRHPSAAHAAMRYAAPRLSGSVPISPRRD